MSAVGFFNLSADMIKLKCDCGGSEMSIVYGKDSKVRVGVPCILCPNPHQFTLSSSVFFEKDLEGRITALKTNMSEVNRLKTDILNIINDEILALDHSDIGIPLGSLFFPEVLSGKGPAIPVHILSIRNSDANFVSHFSQAGINQTLHRLNMQVSIDVAVLVLGQTSSFSMSSEVVVAETVIVGDVPQTYLQTGGYYGSEKEN